MLTKSLTHKHYLENGAKAELDLIVRAYAARGRNPLVSSPLIMNALPYEEVNLVVGETTYRGATEFAVVKRRLEPKLVDLDLDKLSPQCVLILGRQSKVDAIKAATYIKARKLEQSTGVATEALYGLMSQQMPVALQTLVSQEPDLLRRALTAAIDGNVISKSYQSRIDEVINTIQVRKASLALLEWQR